jgi:hypothetical protein
MGSQLPQLELPPPHRPRLCPCTNHLHLSSPRSARSARSPPRLHRSTLELRLRLDLSRLAGLVPALEACALAWEVDCVVRCRSGA